MGIILIGFLIAALLVIAFGVVSKARRHGTATSGSDAAFTADSSDGGGHGNHGSHCDTGHSVDCGFDGGGHH